MGPDWLEAEPLGGVLGSLVGLLGLVVGREVGGDPEEAAASRGGGAAPWGGGTWGCPT